MPIYEQTYRRYEARGPLRNVRFWPIAREALRHVLAKRAFLGLLALSWLPFVVRLVQVFVVTRFPEAGRVLPVNGGMFGEFLNQQIGLTLLLSAFGGAGLIANDLRTGAILVYLSRPLTRRDYVLGKLTVLLALNLAVTLAPGLLLYAAALALAPEQFAAWSLAWIGPAIVAHSLLVALAAGLLALAVSSIARSARVAGLSFVLLFVGLGVVGAVLKNVLDTPATALVSPQGDLELVGRALFGVAAQDGVHWAWAALVLAALGAGCVLILRSRVRAVEVVA